MSQLHSNRPLKEDTPDHKIILYTLFIIIYLSAAAERVHTALAESLESAKSDKKVLSASYSVSHGMG